MILAGDQFRFLTVEGRYKKSSHDVMMHVNAHRWETSHNFETNYGNFNRRPRCSGAPLATLFHRRTAVFCWVRCIRNSNEYASPDDALVHTNLGDCWCVVNAVLGMATPKHRARRVCLYVPAGMWVLMVHGTRGYPNSAVRRTGSG